eukprot:c13153_g1_i1 orf=424-1416(-)
MAEAKYNLKNPAVKRILQEVKEMQNNPSDDYMSLPVEDNIFEWQFAIRGPKDTEFEGGIYHGRIQLPSEYPFKPPSFMLLTPNGRFETQTKVCLSISQYHPEHWQPSWSVRTALVALIAFLPTKPDGAIGSLDYTKEERHALAIKSRAVIPRFGNEERQKLIDEIHDYMVKKAPPVPDLPANTNDEFLAPTSEDGSDTVGDNSGMEVNTSLDGARVPQDVSATETGEFQSAHNFLELHANTNAGSVAAGFSAGISVSTRNHGNRQASDAAVVNRALNPIETNPEVIRMVRTQQHDDRGLTLVAIGLTVALVALLLKKFMKSYCWFDAGSL